MNSAHIAETPLTQATPLTLAVHEALARALRGDSRLGADCLALPGMSGRRYRQFINNLVAGVADARYLEIGCWAGSTLCAAIAGNRGRVLAIDNWSEFGGPLKDFLRHVSSHAGEGLAFNLLTADFRQVNFSSVGRFNLYLFDGPHGEADHYDGVRLPLNALDDEFVLIVDDWNWASVRTGTLRAVHELGLSVLHAIEIRTTLDGSHPAEANEHSDWHNGYCISVLRKPALDIRAVT